MVSMLLEGQEGLVTGSAIPGVGAVIGWHSGVSLLISLTGPFLTDCGSLFPQRSLIGSQQLGTDGLYNNVGTWCDVEVRRI